VRHLAVGLSCPMDGTLVSRSHCSACPSFVSYRATEGVATVGCGWGDDVAGWLRREMRRAEPAPEPSPRTRRNTGLGGAGFGLFLAAFGVGLVLSTLERPD